MRHIQGISRHQLQLNSLEDKITANLLIPQKAEPLAKPKSYLVSFRYDENLDIGGSFFTKSFNLK